MIHTDHGSICLLGTPGLLANGLFFDVTTGRQAGWKAHEWTTHDNTAPSPGDPGKTCAQVWAEEIAQLEAMNPDVRSTPAFRRNYLREWVIEDDALVYRYQPGRNDFDELPKEERAGWSYVLGIDLGYSDASAFALLAYHRHDQTTYVLEVFKKTKMDVTDVANKIRQYQQRFEIDYLIVDGANKQAVEEIRKRHELPLHAADKREKAEFIEIMNADFNAGKIKLKRGTCMPLVEEYRSVIWDQRSVKRQEHPSCENHAADATLYGWRHCYSYLGERPPAEPKPFTPEWYQREEEQMEEWDRERAEREMMEQLEDETWEEAAQRVLRRRR